MIQSILLILMLATGAALAQMNGSTLHAPVSLTIPGLPDGQVSNYRLLVGAAALLAILWLAGMVDLAVALARVRRRDALLRAKDREIMRIKSEAFDRQQSALTDIRMRLETFTTEVDTMLGRFDNGAVVKRERTVREETRSTAPERPMDTPMDTWVALRK